MNIDLPRIQFTFTSVSHFFFGPVAIGLVFLTALLHTAWHRSGRDEYLWLTRLFGTLLVIHIAIGMVTGIVQEFEFWMTWGADSRLVGNRFEASRRSRGWPRSAWSRRSWGRGCSGGTSCPSGCTY